MTSEDSPADGGDHDPLARIKPAWNEVLQRLRLLIPESRVDGRLRPDVYGAGKGFLARDSAGVRVIVGSLPELHAAAVKARSLWPVSEQRDYLAGHPRTPHYRALHIYYAVQGFEVEVQFRTARQHVLAEWTHSRFLPPLRPPWEELASDSAVVTFLTALGSACDARDRGIAAALPNVPKMLRQFFDLDTDALA